MAGSAEKLRSAYKEDDNNDIFLEDFAIYGSSRLGIFNINKEVVDLPNIIDNTNPVQTEIGNKYYELSNHLGNVLTTVSDRKLEVEDGSSGTIAYYTADILSSSDYYPFGFAMDGRDYSSDSYRYGFNGKEKDDEFTNSTSHYDFGARIYDSRVGRWLAVDPKFNKYPYASPYVYTLNNPILFIDPNGEEVTIRDVASLKAVLNTLSSSDLERISLNSDGTLNIAGSHKGSDNLETLRFLVDSERNYNVMTGTSYESKAGPVNLPATSGGRCVVPNSPGNDQTLQSPDDDIYIIIKPTTETGAPEVAAHELLGHGYLYEKREQGDASVNPWHKYEQKNGKWVDTNPLTTSGHSWPRISEARRNVRNGTSDTKRKEIIDGLVEDFEFYEAGGELPDIDTGPDLKSHTR